MGIPASSLHGRAWCSTQGKILGVVVVAGLVVRLVLAFGYTHSNYDIESFLRVGQALHQNTLGVYGIAGKRWPYPPTFFPWILASLSLAFHAGLPFAALIKLPSIIADGVLAVVIYEELLRSGRDPVLALIAGCLVVMGPVFVLNAAYHGQIDSVAVLPAVAAVIVWRRVTGPPRAIAAGLLLGLAASVKTPVGLTILALLPTCRSWREGAALIGGMASVLVVLIAPFLVTTPVAVIHSLTFTDVSGVGGINLVLVLDLHLLGLARILAAHVVLVISSLVLGVLAVLWHKRPVSPYWAAGLLWLGFYSVSTSFFFGYLIWGIPFFLLAGYIRATAVLMAITVIPAVMFETGVGLNLPLYEVTMTAAWIGFGLSFMWQGGRLLRVTAPVDV